MTDQKVCPYCGEEIKSGAIKCKHCHSMLDVSGDSAQAKPEATIHARPASVPPQRNFTPSKTNKPLMKRWWVWAAAIILLFIFIGSLGGGEDDPKKTTIEPTVADSAAVVLDDPEPELDAEPAVKTISAGTHLVGIDIEPGIYRSDGGINYWERLSGLSGDLSQILANEAFSPGSVYVEVKASDEAFSFNGSGKFYKVDESYQGKLATSFGDGTYWVGKDIEPGRYRSNTGAQYWARLSGFSGDLGNILANDAFGEGSVIVDIKPSDVGFHTRGAEWEKID